MGWEGGEKRCVRLKGQEEEEEEEEEEESEQNITVRKHPAADSYQKTQEEEEEEEEDESEQHLPDVHPAKREESAALCLSEEPSVLDCDQISFKFKL